MAPSQKESKELFLRTTSPVSEKKTSELNSQAAKTVGLLRRQGIKSPENNLLKLFLNDISPGCRACVNGKWSCIFINRLCTKHCFFCMQDRSAKAERPPRASDTDIFRSVKDYISYLKKVDFQGISFSGGEPFLALELLLEYIREIRKHFGSKHYIWAYTNGGLVTADKLSLLKRAGLNELRFDIASGNYDLAAVQLAVKHIDNVTIEIPVIPEDLKFLKTNLLKFEKLGVKYLNLHQLMANRYNYAAMLGRGYTFIDSNGVNAGILESELAALEILKHAIKIKTKLKINYCSRQYKHYFQSSARREIFAPYAKEALDSVTKTGIVRRLALRVSDKDFLKLKPIKSGNCSNKDAKLWTFDPKLLPKIENKGVPVYVQYFEPAINKKKDFSHRKHIRLGKLKLRLGLMKKNKFLLGNESSIIFFKKLFLERKSIEKTASEVMEYFGLGPRMRNTILQDIAHFYQGFSKWEYLPANFPVYASLRRPK